MEAEIEGTSVKVVDSHSIYQDFAPLGVFAKVLGIFPARNVLRGPYLRREWVSFFVFPVVSLLEYLLFYLYDKDILGYLYNSFDTVRNYVNTLEMYNQAVCSVVQFALMQVYFDRLCTVFRNIDHFDTKMASDVNRPTRRIAIVLTALGIGHVLYSLIELYPLDGIYEYPWEIQIPVVIHIVCGMVILLPLCVVVFLSEAIRRRFALITSAVTEITDHLPKTFADNRTANAVMSYSDSAASVEIDPHLADKLSELCGASDELCDIIANISDALGPCLSVGFLSLLFDIIAFVSSIFIDEEGWEKYMKELVGIIGEVVIRTLILVFTTLILSRISAEATKSVAGLRRVRLLSLDSNSKEQMLQLIERLSSPSISITAAQFFHVNRNLLTAIGTAITTYIIVLVQFKDSEKSGTKKTE